VNDPTYCKKDDADRGATLTGLIDWIEERYLLTEPAIRNVFEVDPQSTS
jgi:hypothetical protein